VSPELFAALEQQAGGLSTDRLLELIEQFAAAETRMKWAPNKKLHFEIAIIKAVQTLEQATLSEILDALAAIRGGGELPARAGGNAGAGEKPARLAASVAPRKAAVAAAAEGSRSSLSVSSSKAAEPEPEPVAVINETPEAGAPSKAPVDPTALWMDLLVAVRRDRPLISTWLEAATLLEVTARSVRLGFPPEHAMAMESLLRPNNRSFLEKLLTRLTGETRALECEAREGLVVTPVSLPEPEPEPAPSPPDPMEEFRNDPLIRKALEIFQGEIQPVNS
jgi:DNA polymerase-3 subunit gamma/tau